MKALLMLALLGLVAAAPRTVTYQYSADLLTGLKQFSDKVSGLRMEALVDLTISEDASQVQFKIKSPKVGTKVEHLPGMRGPLHIVPTVAITNQTQVEKVFSVLVRGSKEILLVPKDDPIWITNLRKAIASVFRVPYVLSTPAVVSRELRIPVSFRKIVETIHGACVERFTLAEDKRVMGSPFRLVKSTDFDSCDDPVSLTKAAQGNYTEVAQGQFRGVQSRSSVGEYKLSGRPVARFSMQVEKANIEGTFMVNPFAFNTHEKLYSLSNQTVTKVSETNKPIDSLTPQSHRREETWSYVVQTTHARAPTTPVWVQHEAQVGKYSPMYPAYTLMGYKLTPELREQTKIDIKQKMEKIMNQIVASNGVVGGAQGTLDGKMVRNITRIINDLYMLTKPDVDELFTYFTQGTSSRQKAQREIYINALTATGSPIAFKVLIERISGGDITMNEAFGIFSTMGVGAADPLVVKDLLAYAANAANDLSPVAMTAFFINLSTMVRRFCIMKPAVDFMYPEPLAGVDKCNKQDYMIYVNLLKNKLKSTSKTFEKAIMIQSLANMGAAEALIEVIDGNRDLDQNLRVLAVSGLTKNNLQNTTYEYVAHKLLSVVEDLNRDEILREAAFMSLRTIPTNFTTMARLAQNTWRDPTERVPRLIYTYLKAVSSMRNPHFIKKVNAARMALPLAKPHAVKLVIPPYIATSDYSLEKNIAYNFEMMHLGNSSLKDQTGLTKGRALLVLGGLKYPLLHWSSIGQGSVDTLKHFKSLLDRVQGTQFTRSHQYRLSQSEMESTRSAEELYLLTLYKEIQFFMPTTKDFMETVLEKNESWIQYIYRQMNVGGRYQTAFFTKLVDSTWFIPSDVGIPIISGAHHNLFSYLELNATMTKSESKMEVTSVTKLVSDYTVLVSMWVPWINATLSVKLDRENTISVPLKSIIKVLPENSAKIVNYNTWVQAASNKQVPLISSNTQAYVVRTPMKGVAKPSAEYILPTTVEPISHCDCILEKFTQRILPSSVADVAFVAELDSTIGLNKTFTAPQGMRQLPFNLIKLFVGPTIKPHQVMITYTPSMKNLKLSGNLTFGNFSPFNQASHPSKVNNIPMVDNLSPLESYHQHLLKISSVGASKMVSASIQMEPSKKYEAVAIVSPVTKDSRAKKLQLQINLMKTSPQPSQICVGSSVTWPVWQRSRDLLTNSLPWQLVTKVFQGQTARQQDQLLKMKATAEISHEVQEMVREGVQPLYDVFKVEIEKSKNLTPKVERILLSSRRLLYPSMEDSKVVPYSTKISEIIAKRSWRDGQLTVDVHTKEGVGKRVFQVPDFIDAIGPFNRI